MKTDDLLQKLADWGCDVKGAKARFLDDTELYVICLNSVLEDAAFANLKKALEDENVKEGFEAAHTLKGVLANLGLTPMLATVVQIVESLRAGVIEGLMGYYEQLEMGRDYLKQLMEMEEI